MTSNSHVVRWCAFYVMCCRSRNNRYVLIYWCYFRTRCMFECEYTPDRSSQTRPWCYITVLVGVVLDRVVLKSSADKPFSVIFLQCESIIDEDEACLEHNPFGSRSQPTHTLLHSNTLHNRAAGGGRRKSFSVYIWRASDRLARCATRCYLSRETCPVFIVAACKTRRPQRHTSHLIREFDHDSPDHCCPSERDTKTETKGDIQGRFNDKEHPAHPTC